LRRVRPICYAEDISSPSYFAALPPKAGSGATRIAGWRAAKRRHGCLRASPRSGSPNAGERTGRDAGRTPRWRPGRAAARRRAGSSPAGGGARPGTASTPAPASHATAGRPGASRRQRLKPRARCERAFQGGVDRGRWQGK